MDPDTNIINNYNNNDTTSQRSRNKTNKCSRLRLGRKMASSTFKTSKVQGSMEGNIQRAPTRKGAPRGGGSIPEGGAAARIRKVKMQKVIKKLA